MGVLGFLGVLITWVMLGILRLGNRGEAGDPPAATPITAETLGAVQGDAFVNLFPEDIRSKPYMKDIKGFGDFVKKFDGSQTLLGQRGMPEATDPDEKWGEYHNKVRPETSDKYVVPVIEGIPPEYVTKLAGNKQLRDILHAAGASSYQAKILLSGIAKTLFGAEKMSKDQNEAAYTKMATDLFGDKKDAILTNGKKFLAANLPASVVPLLEGLDERALAVVLAATDGMAKKYTGEDPFRGGTGGGGSGAETKEQLVAQMQAIMKEPAWSDPFKDRPKHAELETKMNVIRDKLKKLQGGA